MSKITIVNERDEIIGSVERNQRQKDNIYRVCGLWITNQKGEILLAQRSFAKNNMPGMWGPAATGTVEENEGYEESIKREAKEELSIDGIDFKIGPKYRIQTAERSYFGQLFTVVLDWSTDKFVLQKEEVEQIKWFKKEEFLDQQKNHPEIFTPVIKNIIEQFYT